MRRLVFVLAVAVLTGALLSPCLAAARASSHRPSSPSFLEASAAQSATASLISGTARADTIAVSQNLDGSLTVAVDKRVQKVAEADARRLVIDGRAGNDTITVDAGVSVALTIYGGAGDDLIDAGGLGALYADGGPGNDGIRSGSGLGVLFGGTGDDQLTINGAGGSMAGGPGVDTYAGGSSSTQVFAQRSEQIASPGRATWVHLGSTDAAGHAPGYALQPRGSAAFRLQVGSDVTALLSVPAGRKLLIALDDAGHAIGVTATAGGNDTTILDPASAFLRAGGKRGAGSDSVVSYDPYETTIDGGSQAWQQRPPLVGLVHELVHALNAATGTLQPGKNATGTPKLELQAIGLPFKGIAFRWTAAAAASSHNPRVFTENGFRALLGLALRTGY